MTIAPEQRVEDLVRALNAAWSEGRLEDLAAFYHPDVVLLPPDAGTPIVGRDAVVASYDEFDQAATLHEFAITDISTHLFGNTAICHMRFTVDYDLAGNRYQEGGLEVYVLTDVASGPRIVWRSQT